MAWGNLDVYMSAVYNRVMHSILKELKEGQDSGFDPSFIKISTKSSLACGVSKPILRVG